MSLKVWLPLNGDLRNQGISDYTTDLVSGNVFTTPGKIGNNSLHLTKLQPILPNSTASCMRGAKQMSYAYWIKVNTAWEANWLDGIRWVSTDGSTTHTSRQEFYTNCTLIGTWFQGDSISGKSFTPGVWTHIAGTFNYNTGEVCFYINGTLSQRKTTLATTHYCRGDFWIGDNGVDIQQNDVRIYDHCLSAAEVKEIAQGLVIHYKLDDYKNFNLIDSGWGETLVNWNNEIRVSTDVPANTNIKRSFYNQWTKKKVPIISSHTYKFSCYVKSTGTSGYTYPSFQPYDIDGKALNYYHEPEGFQSVTRTTLAQPLAPGDTKIYATSLANWPDHTNSRMVAIFSYRDGHGNLYPDWTYTQNTPGYGTSANLDKTNNIITLSAAYTGPYMPAGTSICQTVYGSTYWYPFGGITKTSISDWTYKEMTFIPQNINRLKFAQYIVYLADWSNDILHAGMTLIDLNEDQTKIQDSSGYDNNGEVTTNFSSVIQTPRYTEALYFNGINNYIKIPYNAVCPDNIFTCNVWFKKEAIGSKNYETIFGGPSGFEMDVRAGSASTLSFYMAGTRSTNRNTVTPLTFGEWFMLTMVRDGTKERYYVNGIFQSEIDAKSMPTGNYYIGAWSSTTSQNYEGLLSDFRLYNTPLLDTDIKQLYNVGMKIDKQGAVHPFELIENNTNLLFPVELSRTNLSFSNGLSRYTQANCQVTLTDQGYRIYRPPNLTTANDGNTMWGGLLINNQTSRVIQPYNATQDNIFNLQKNHTYMFAFHAKGQSSNSPSLVVESNMGWDRIAGVGPNPTYIKSRTIPADFNGEQDCYIIFKIEDDIVKVATENKSSYIQGSSYLSYRDLCLNYGYTNTGTLGTDLYLTNFRLYDITTAMAKITKQGQTKFDDFVEQLSKTQVRRNSELLSSQFIER